MGNTFCRRKAETNYQPPNNNEIVHVHVHTITQGMVEVVQVRAGESVAELKRQIREATGVPEDRQSIYNYGHKRIFEDDDIIALRRPLYDEGDKRWKLHIDLTLRPRAVDH